MNGYEFAPPTDHCGEDSSRNTGRHTQSMAVLASMINRLSTCDHKWLSAQLTALLRAHVCSAHDDSVANAVIRRTLDQIELVLALEIERSGLRVQNA